MVVLLLAASASGKLKSKDEKPPEEVPMAVKPVADDLPLLNVPRGQAVLVLAGYHRLAPMFEKRDMRLELLELTARGSWRARLEDGAAIELGLGSLDDIQSRAERFIATLTQVSSRFGRNLESADLRYSNGYALKLRGVTTTVLGGKEDRKAKR